MRSTATVRPSTRARRASRSQAARALARAGLAARGVLYILIGWVAILVAFGQKSGNQANQAGALQMLARQPLGLVLLWLLGIGFAGYALWRFSEAAFGVTGEGNGAGPRLKSLVRGAVYAFFAYLTFEIIAGTAGNESKKQQDMTATVMHHTGGQVVVGIVGAVIVVIGVALVLQGLRRKFLRDLQTSQMSPRTRRVVEWLGVIGTAARGVVFALAGVLVIEAAVTHNSAKAGGIDKALLTLRDQPFGQVLLILAALGLIIFGVYGLCEARWRKV
jgi:amino acid transporter